MIIFKTFANRLQDWADIEGILENNHKFLNFEYIDQQLLPLLDLKDEPENLQKLKELTQRVKSSNLT